MIKKNLLWMFVSLALTVNMAHTEAFWGNAFSMRAENLALYHVLNSTKRIIGKYENSEETIAAQQLINKEMSLLRDIVAEFNKGSSIYIHSRFRNICDYFKNHEFVEPRHLRIFEKKVEKFDEFIQRYFAERRTMLTENENKLCEMLHTFNDILLSNFLKYEYFEIDIFDRIADCAFYRPIEEARAHPKITAAIILAVVITVGFYAIKWKQKHDAELAEAQAAAEQAAAALVDPSGPKRKPGGKAVPVDPVLRSLLKIEDADIDGLDLKKKLTDVQEGAFELCCVDRQGPFNSCGAHAAFNGIALYEHDVAKEVVCNEARMNKFREWGAYRVVRLVEVAFRDEFCAEFNLNEPGVDKVELERRRDNARMTLANQIRAVSHNLKYDTIPVVQRIEDTKTLLDTDIQRINSELPNKVSYLLSWFARTEDKELAKKFAALRVKNRNSLVIAAKIENLKHAIRLVQENPERVMAGYDLNGQQAGLDADDVRLFLAVEQKDAVIAVIPNLTFLDQNNGVLNDLKNNFARLVVAFLNTSQPVIECAQIGVDEIDDYLKMDTKDGDRRLPDGIGPDIWDNYLKTACNAAIARIKVLAEKDRSDKYVKQVLIEELGKVKKELITNCASGIKEDRAVAMVGNSLTDLKEQLHSQDNRVLHLAVNIGERSNDSVVGDGQVTHWIFAKIQRDVAAPGGIKIVMADSLNSVDHTKKMEDVDRRRNSRAVKLLYNFFKVTD